MITLPRVKGGGFKEEWNSRVSVQKKIESFHTRFSRKTTGHILVRRGIVEERKCVHKCDSLGPFTAPE